MVRHRGAHTRLPLLALVALLPLFIACSEDDPCVRDEHSSYAERAPFDVRSRVRRVDCGFSSNVAGMSTGADGSAWLRRFEYKDRGEDTFFHPPDKLLTHVGAGGELLAELTLPDFVIHHVVHPSGELTVFGWDTSRDEDPMAIQVRRLRADGSVITTRRLVNETPPELRLDYKAAPDGTITKMDLPEKERFASLLLARADGEDTVFVAGLDGLRVGRLDSTLATRWLSPVAPTVVLNLTTWEQMTALGAPLVGMGLDVDEHGRTHVATPMLGVQRLAYVHAFREHPMGPETRSILLSSFSATGELLSARAIPAPSPQEITGLVVRKGAFALGASERASAGGRPVLAPDLFFASGRLDAPVEEDLSLRLDVDRDDAPASFFACGEGRDCFAGHTAFEPQETGPAWTDGQGFILAVDARGTKQDALFLQGPRDTRVLTAVERPGGSAVFAFTTNEAPDKGRVASHLKNNGRWLGLPSSP